MKCSLCCICYALMLINKQSFLQKAPLKTLLWWKTWLPFPIFPSPWTFSTLVFTPLKVHLPPPAYTWILEGEALLSPPLHFVILL